MPLERASLSYLGSIPKHTSSGGFQKEARLLKSHILTRVMSLRTISMDVLVPRSQYQWCQLIFSCPTEVMADDPHYLHLWLYSLPALNWRILNITTREIQVLFPASPWSYFLNKSMHYLFMCLCLDKPHLIYILIHTKYLYIMLKQSWFSLQFSMRHFTAVLCLGKLANTVALCFGAFYTANYQKKKIHIHTYGTTTAKPCKNKG